MPEVSPLSPEALRRTEPAELSFETTAELEPKDDDFEQGRALDALRFGIGMRSDCYNLFVLGPQGAGRHTMVRQFLRERAARSPTPPDWCYVNNFAEPQKPKAIRLPAGRGATLRDDMDRLIEELRVAIPAAFEGEDYRVRRATVSDAFKERHEQAFAELAQRAEARNVTLIRTPAGLALAPKRGDEVLKPDEFAKLDEDEQRGIERDLEELSKELQEVIRQVPRWERERREKIRELDREVTRYAVGHLIDDLRCRYVDQGAVLAYLDEVRDDILEHTASLLHPAQQALAGALGDAIQRPDEAAAFQRYKINVLVDHRETKGAPVVYQDQPTQQSLVGRIEHVSQLGALVTNFTLIKPGDLHRSSGGYLVLDARTLLLQPFAWEDLKRALRAREVRIESLAQRLSLVATVSLEPQPISIDVKVVLIGERWLYYLLSALDPEFGELFKVPADLDDRIDRTPREAMRQARLIAALARNEALRPFDRHALARIVEHASRLCGDQRKVTAQTSSLVDLAREADYQAGEAQHRVVTAADVQSAIDAQIHRASRLRDRMHEEIKRGVVLIDTRGEKVGQVNGLSLIGLGGHAFAQPTRITARVWLGKGQVVDIEREVELGGPIHSKGVLILGGFLGERFARERPLTLAASLVFEQSYGGVEGDSASSAELYALLSALARVPIAQRLAVTGSVNQHGEVQAVGGINEKIEGFFDVCERTGLTGDQGVLIPAANVEHLMLRHDVVEAVRAGRFDVLPIANVDQGIELLTGRPAGERDASGRFPERSINRLVEDELDRMAQRARAFSAPPRGSGDGGT
jgi:lon-related putative ATP-dependent protease